MEPEARRWTAAIAAGLAAIGLSACSGGDQITVDITFSGEGVEQATIIFDPRLAERSEASRLDAADLDPLALNVDDVDPYAYAGTRTETVSLPWSTTLIVDNEGGTTEFSVIAINESGSGSLRCDADWSQADGDGTWGRSGEFIAGCAGDVRFDGNEVRLDPQGRSVSFDSRDERYAEIEAESAAEQARVDALIAAIDNARPAGPIELDGWLIEPTGVNRDAGEVLEAESSRNNVTNRNRAVLTELTVTRTAPTPGRVTEVQVGAIGGWDLERFDHDDDNCGNHVPDDWLDLPNPELATGQSAVFNTCLIVPAEQSHLAMAEISVFLGDEAPVVMVLPDAGTTGTREVVGSEATGSGPPAERASIMMDGGTMTWDVGVVAASVNDVDTISERIGEEVSEGNRSLVMVDFEIIATGEQGALPGGPTWFADIRLESADGSGIYGSQDWCPRVFDIFTAAPAPEGGVDWNFGDEQLLLFDSEPKTFAICVEVEPEDVPGIILTIAAEGEEINFATGL